MKTSKTLAFILLLAAFNSFNMFAQDKIKFSNKFRLTSFYLFTGISTQQNRIATLEEFQSLAPNSQILKGDYTDFTEMTGKSRSGNSLFSVAVGLKLTPNNKPVNTSLRLGFNYFSGITVFGGVYKEYRSAYDTLTSSQTGQTYYMDSISSKSVSMQYLSEQLHFDGSLIFSTNSEERWSLFTGIGFTAGLSINANTNIYYYQYDRVESYNSGNGYYGADSGSSIDYKLDFMKNKNVKGYSVYVPFGVDFRIGKKREFWKRTHLYYEFRPCLSVTMVPELTTFSTTKFQQGLGLRVNWK